MELKPANNCTYSSEQIYQKKKSNVLTTSTSYLYKLDIIYFNVINLRHGLLEISVV